MIYFNQDLAKEALKIAHETHELSDVLNDLNRINATLSSVPSIENLVKAKMLDDELRSKYPTIDKMIALANSLPVYPVVNSQRVSNDLPEYANLNQDYFGILCDVLLKKQVTTSIEQFVEKVDQT